MPPRKKDNPKPKQKPQAAVSAWGDSNVMTMFPFGVTRTFEEKSQKSQRRISWMDDDDWELRARDEERGLGDVVQFDEDGTILDFRRSLQHQETFSHFYGSEKLKSQFELKRREDEKTLAEMMQAKRNPRDDDANSDSSDLEILKDRTKLLQIPKRREKPKRFNGSDSDSDRPASTPPLPNKRS
eukprot:GEMP01042959.1.p1 GENE.GEMP01042959.1~~GEMP01042959.1.p1  ORF type:complete len:184 (+),score=44.86 GEMP01042959.1:369-920(+)